MTRHGERETRATAHDAPRHPTRADGAAPDRRAELDRKVEQTYDALNAIGTPVMSALGAEIARTADEAAALAAEAERTRTTMNVVLGVAVGVIAALLAMVAFLLSRSVQQAIREQAQSIEQVNRAVSEMDKMVRTFDLGRGAGDGIAARAVPPSGPAHGGTRRRDFARDCAGAELR